MALLRCILTCAAYAAAFSPASAVPRNKQLAPARAMMRHTQLRSSALQADLPAVDALDADPEGVRAKLTSRMEMAPSIRFRGGNNMSPSRVTLLGAIVNVMLSMLKLVVGTASGSASLVADAYHSGSDLLVDAVTMLAVHAPPAFERAATLAIGGLLALTGGGLMWSAMTALWKRALPSASEMMGVPPLLVALVAISAKELLFRVTRAVGLRTRQAVLLASAKHHRADALSSLAAAVGAAGVLLGVPIADTIAAACVGGMMVSMGASVACGGEH